jgi:cell division protein FtsI (penicillin-binding protein 3)
MSGHREVSGAYEAYRRSKATPGSTPDGRRSRRPSEPRRATPAPARRPVQGRGERRAPDQRRASDPQRRASDEREWRPPAERRTTAQRRTSGDRRVPGERRGGDRRVPGERRAAAERRTAGERRTSTDPYAGTERRASTDRRATARRGEGDRRTGERRGAERRAVERRALAERRTAAGRSPRRSEDAPAGRGPGPRTVSAAMGRHPARPGRPTPPHVLRRRLAAIPVRAVVLFAVVAFKLVDVQVRNPDLFLAQGEQQRIGSTQLAAGRGAILDRNGEALALSVPRQTIFADPTLIDDPEAVAELLGPVLDVPRFQLERLMSVDGEFSVLARTVPDAVAAEVRELKSTTRGLAGIGMFQEFERINPSGDLARSIVGGVSEDGADGISGLEMQLDEALTGTPGQVTYEKSKAGGGGTITGTRRRIEPARPGSAVNLTIDQVLQFEAERVLGEHLERAGAMGGTAIVSRPSTGEILALANLTEDEHREGTFVPTSDNVALTSVYEPGSVNKVITVAAAIEEGLVTPDTTMFVPDSYQIGDKEFTDSHPHETTEWSVTDILATSSNVGTIMLARQLGSERMDAFLRRFGFGSQTGLGFPSESAGIMLPPEEWDRQSTAIGSIPIGQSLSVTAVQMIQAFNVLANDGTYVPARLVREVTGPDGEAESVPSGEPRRVVSPETAAAVRAMMAQVVERGTGQLAAVPGYSVAGKTGTARKPQPGGGYEDENGQMHYFATFAGLLPAENPDLSIIVVMDEPDPSKSIYAADVAAPAFADLARFALRRLGIPPSAGGDVADVPEMSASAREIGDAPVQGAPRREDEEADASASADGAVAEGDEPIDPIDGDEGSGDGSGEGDEDGAGAAGDEPADGE